ncbi:MAG: site-specific integrase [Phycisphaerales bacterium]|nr:site-specific integrase [Phycisphaerales bacterium]
MSRDSAIVIRIPAYTLHKPSGTARVRIGGEYHSLGRYGTPESRAKYEALVEAWRARGCPTFRVPQEPCVSSIILGYWKHLNTHRKLENLWSERMALRTIRVAHGLDRASSFGPKRMRELMAVMAHKGWCRSTVNHRASIIRAMFCWAASEELIDAGVWHALQSVRGLRRGEHGVKESEGVGPVATSIVDLTLAHLTKTVAAMVRVQLLTGARPGEICAMTTGQIDTSGDVWRYRLVNHKTAHHGKTRSIDIGPMAQVVLKPFLKADLSAPIFSPAESEEQRLEALHKERKTRLSCGNKPGSNRKRKPKKKPGDRYTTGSYRRAIERACDRAGVPRWSPNQLRHTRATQIRHRYGLEAAGAVLGHSKVETTQVYAERDAALARQVALESG